MGHQVLESQSALDAVELVQHHSGRIDILLTDVVMPELRGPELARQVKELHPDIHIIYRAMRKVGLTRTFLPRRHSCKNHFDLQL